MQIYTYMISYLTSVKSATNPGVYNRGVRLYLDGTVSKPTSLILDNWRKYCVQGTTEYEVKIPLLHLTMSMAQFDRAGEVISQMVTCECEYYYSYGICKHIVAVCASLDSEFGGNQKPTLIKESTFSPSVLDSIFQAEKVKQHRKWNEIVEMYLSREHSNYFYLDGITKAVMEEPLNHDEFLADLNRIGCSVIGDYSKEKLLLKIILETVLVGKKAWWDIWFPFLLKFDERNQTRLFVGLWKIRWLGGGKDYQDEFDRLLVSLKGKEKAAIFSQLQIEFENQREIWLEFCFVSQYFDWFEENIDLLDPYFLARLCTCLPEKREDYEYKILNQVKLWADFLQAGNYTEVIEFFEYWQQTLGRSEVYEDAVKYFRTAHPKKKKLLAGMA